MNDLSGSHVKGYELHERIGAGGFGAVYRAYQSTVGREVAVKIILPGYANRPDFIRRFDAEAQIVARLEHPYIVPLHDYWRDPDGAYLVMRYLRGGSLRDALRQEAYDLETASLLLDQIAAALSIAHRSHVVHRDIKPANILLDEDSNAYLADFGIAKDVGQEEGAVTDPSALVGSPDYLAPEQARSESVTPQTDIYSLGIVLYEMLAGEHPYPGMTPVERLFKHLNEPVPELTGIDEDIAEEVNAVIQQATAKDPARRFADVMQMAAAFREAAALSGSRAEFGLVALLTPREQEVLQLLLDGKSNREIADALTIEMTTAKWHIRQIYRKLNVRSRVQAIVKARELNLIVDGRVADTSTTSISNLPEPENPYKGLRAFQAADERDFFGREKLTEKLLSRLQADTPDSRFLAVVGPSGSGKSSLVRAGLIPALWRGEIPGSEEWYVIEMLPGSRPLDELEVALTRVAGEQVADLGEHLHRDAAGLIRAAGIVLPDDGSELVVVIDQFEEVFTLVEEEARRAHFLDLIHAAVTDPRSRVRVVVTLRADFYDRPLHYPGIAELIQARTETVLPLSSDELERAIAQPAKQVGVRFEEGLVATIVGEVHYQPGALPLLQYALTELFEQRENRHLTHAAYQQIGGTVGALAARAEEIYAELDSTGQDAAHQMFLRLVTLGEGVEDTRRRVDRRELLDMAADADLMDEVIDTYAAYRLLALDNDPSTRRPTVEVAHEALLREWDRLREWLNDSRSDIRLQRQLARAAREWNDADHDSGFLVPGGARLEQFESWAQSTELALTQLETDYLHASIDAESERQAREKQQARTRRNLQRGFIGALIGGLVVAIGLAVFAFGQQRLASDEREAAETQAAILLAALAEGELEAGFHDRAILLALAALEDFPYTTEAERALGQAVTFNRQELFFDVHTSSVDAIDWSPDGTRIATVEGSNNVIIIWDAMTGEEIHRITDFATRAIAVKWSPDGSKLATMNTNLVLNIEFVENFGLEANIWDSETGELLNRLPGSDSQQQILQARKLNSSIAWTPDGSRLAMIDGQDHVVVWDLNSNESVLSISIEDNTELDLIATAVAWSNDGSRLALSSGENTLGSMSVPATITIVDVPSGDTGLSFPVGTQAISDIEWADDDTAILIAGSANLSDDFAPDRPTAAMWSTSAGDLLWSIEDERNISSANFSPDNKSLFTSTADGTVTLWDIESQSDYLHLAGHDGSIHDAEWSPDSARIATASQDSSVRIWNVDPNPTTLLEADGPGFTVEWSPDGTKILAVISEAYGATQDGFAIWDAQSFELLSRFVDQDHDTLFGFHTLIWTEDSTQIVASLADWPVNEATVFHVYDVQTLDLLFSFDTLGLNVWSAISPDGTLLIAPNFLDNSTRLWDVQSGQLAETFTGDVNQSLVAWSPVGDRFASVAIADQAFQIWTLDSDTPLHTLEVESPGVNIGWSRDALLLATASGDVNSLGTSGNTVDIWDAVTGEHLQSMDMHTGAVVTVNVFPDGKRVVSGSADGTARVWDIETGKELLRLPHPASFFFWADLSPDGTRLATRTVGPDIRIWRVWRTTQELIDYARECCIFRELTPEERAQFGLPPADDLSGESESSRAPVPYLPSLASIGMVAIGFVVMRHR